MANACNANRKVKSAREKRDVEYEVSSANALE